MTIGAISDTHGKLQGLDFRYCDIGVFAGDIAPTYGFSDFDLQDQVEWMVHEFSDFVKSFPDTEFVVIPGNHDLFADASKWRRMKNGWLFGVKKLPKNVHFLCNSGKTVKGISFYGMSWVPYINNQWAFEDMPMTDHVYRECKRIPEGIDILITHSPPRFQDPDIAIDVSLENPPELQEHFGSSDIFNAILRTKPKVAFCGHIHSGDHEVHPVYHMMDGHPSITDVYNVSHVNEGYYPTYDIRKIEFEK